MAETMSIQNRIRSLNLSHVAEVGRPRPLTKPKPSPPPPIVLHRSHSASHQSIRPQDNQAPTVGNLPSGDEGIAPPRRPEPKRPPPILPPRTASRGQPPPLPSRHSSKNILTRRTSIESTSSNLSARSSISGQSSLATTTSASRTTSSDGQISYAVPLYDPASLPPLPLKKSEQRPALPLYSNSAVPEAVGGNTSARVPPPLPTRGTIFPGSTSNYRISANTNGDRLELPKRSALACGLSQTTEISATTRNRSERSPSRNRTAPTVPLASRPILPSPSPRLSVAGLDGSSHQPQAPSCLKCRDFSGPDSHAARFPRQAIPSTDLTWLAHNLTYPFPSATDKARVIFTWLHHNVAYNTEAFFSGVHQPGTPAYVLSTGLAVCEGYAALFAALATHAGLESLVVGGHGKGFGHKDLQPGDPVPSFNSNHAWNAVKIDDGEWKLIEPCWGAGYLDSSRSYNKRFAAENFTMTNEEFGTKHYPTDRNHFFRTDGGRPTWEEYFLGADGPGENVTVYTGCVTEHGLKETGFLPRKKHIQTRGAAPTKRIQFQFESVCEHWDNERKGLGRPYVYVLAVGGKDGRQRDNIPFQTNGRHWWVDVSVEELGCAGQTVSLYSVTSIGGQEGRGMTVADFKAAKGRKGMGFGGVAAWQLV